MEQFSCNSGSHKLGKIVVKVRFGSKISQILKIKISPKNSNLSEYEVYLKSLSVKTQRFDVTREPPRQILRYHPSLKILSVWRGVWGTIWLQYWLKQEMGKIVVKVRFGCKISQIWKIQISPKNWNISEYEVVPKSPWVRTQRFDVARDPPRQILRFHSSLKNWSVWRGVWGAIWLQFW